MHHTMGWFTVYIFYFSAASNLLSIALIATYGGLKQCRRNYLRREGLFKCCKKETHR